MKKKILLVEDDRTMQNLLKTLLQIEGFEVVVIDEKPETDFLSIFLTEKPDIILMDVLLKFNNGLDLAQSIRAINLETPIKIVLTSGNDYKTQSERLGADWFIQKPYMPDVLIKILKEL